MTATTTAPYDGNAIAGTLLELFGVEMTVARGTCAACGARRLVAELEVYLPAPGTVVRCPDCHALLMIVTSIGGYACVDMRGIAELAMPPAGG